MNKILCKKKVTKLILVIIVTFSITACPSPNLISSQTNYSDSSSSPNPSSYPTTYSSSPNPPSYPTTYSSSPNPPSYPTYSSPNPSSYPTIYSSSPNPYPYDSSLDFFLDKQKNIMGVVFGNKNVVVSYATGETIAVTTEQNKTVSSVIWESSDKSKNIKIQISPEGLPLNYLINDKDIILFENYNIENKSADIIFINDDKTKKTINQVKLSDKFFSNYKKNSFQIKMGIKDENWFRWVSDAIDIGLVTIDGVGCVGGSLAIGVEIYSGVGLLALAPTIGGTTLSCASFSGGVQELFSPNQATEITNLTLDSIDCSLIPYNTAVNYKEFLKFKYILMKSAKSALGCALSLNGDINDLTQDNQKNIYVEKLQEMLNVGIQNYSSQISDQDKLNTLERLKNELNNNTNTSSNSNTNSSTNNNIVNNNQSQNSNNISSDNLPYFSGMYLKQNLVKPEITYFSGKARDSVGLSKITMDVYGPNGNHPSVFSENISGTEIDLSKYYFNSNDSNYSGVSGTYTVSLWIKDTAGQSVNFPFTVYVSEPNPAPITDASPYFSGMYLKQNLVKPEITYFSGKARDSVGLSKITMDVYGPNGNHPSVFSENISGTEIDLSKYYFNSNDSNYSGVSGTYTVSLWIKDTAGQSVNFPFTVYVN